eukprot:2049510-Amphidinium_carterae.1
MFATPLARCAKWGDTHVHCVSISTSHGAVETRNSLALCARPYTSQLCVGFLDTKVFAVPDGFGSHRTNSTKIGSVFALSNFIGIVGIVQRIAFPCECLVSGRFALDS